MSRFAARLDRLALIWGDHAEAVTHASWEVQWAVQFPDREATPENAGERAAALLARHGLTAEQGRRAVTQAFQRMGESTETAIDIGTLGVAKVLELAAMIDPTDHRGLVLG